MSFFGVILALFLIGVVFIDTFEAVILPRRVRHAYRLARFFYQVAWGVWSALSLLLRAGRWRYAFLSVFGPVSLILLIGVWASGLVTGFALLHWSLGTPLTAPHDPAGTLTTYLYFSGTTFFTLGYGDMVPTGTLGRFLSVVEAGIGFAFLAVVISYLPVIYQAFSRREITISLLDARAGSPPSAGELLRRMSAAGSLKEVVPLLVEWERWAAELLESHLSFPALRYYRSQHDNQSWLGALTMILDTSAFLVAGMESLENYQARLTFAMARHAAVDLVLVAQTSAQPVQVERLSSADLRRLVHVLRGAGVVLREDEVLANSLLELRGLYEPFIAALAEQLLLELPPFVPDHPPIDNWQTGPGMKRSPGLRDLQARAAREEHSR